MTRDGKMATQMLMGIVMMLLPVIIRTVMMMTTKMMVVPMMTVLTAVGPIWLMFPLPLSLTKPLSP